jgi:hypothetical protein
MTRIRIAVLFGSFCLPLLAGDAYAQQVVTVRNKKTGQALTAYGQVAVQAPLINGNPAQRWSLVLIPNTNPPQYQFVSLLPGATQTVLTVERGDERTGVNLTTPTPDQANQRWVLKAVGAYFELIPLQHDNRRLEVPGGFEQSQIQVQIFKPNGGDHQRWLIDYIQ